MSYKNKNKKIALKLIERDKFYLITKNLKTRKKNKKLD